MTQSASQWTSTNYPLLNDEQAKLFRLLDDRIRVLGKPSSRADGYITYKKDPEMKGGFVRISVGKRPNLNVHLALIKHSRIYDPHSLACYDHSESLRWSRGSLLVKCTSESSIDHIMDLIRQAYDYALINDRSQ